MTSRWTFLRPSSRLSPTIDVLSYLSVMNLADGWFWGYPFRLHCQGPIVEQWWSYNRFICLALFMSQLKMALIVWLWKSESPFKHLSNANQKGKIYVITNITTLSFWINKGEITCNGSVGNDRSPMTSGNVGWRVRSTLYSLDWRVTVVRQVGTCKCLSR